MAFIEGRPDLSMPVWCPRCGWRGRLDEAVVKEDCPVTCPRCPGVNVLRERDSGRRADSYKHTGGPHVGGA